VSMTASVAAGQLTIEVPPGVEVDITEHGGGNIQYPQGYQYFVQSLTPSKHQSVLDLEASVGVGQIELIRSAPGLIDFYNN
jgi:hypothetical protein